MISYRYLFFAFLMIGLFSCNNDKGTDFGPATIETGGESGIADIIRNPATANEEDIDKSQLAQMSFPEDRYNFGSVDAGAVIKHEFEFTNTGQVPLIIGNVATTCGCTAADWPRQPIAPGESGVIPVSFDTKNKSGRQSKPITITANTFPAKITIYLDGQVDEVPR